MNESLPAIQTIPRPAPARECPFVSVIVPVRNEQPFIRATLEQLLQQDYDPERFEVLVADGRSTDATRLVVRELAAAAPNLKLLDNPGALSSSGRNVALRAAQGEIIVIVDGHCHLDNPHYLRNVVDAFRRSGADCLGRPQPLDVPGANALQRAVARARASRLGHHPGSFIYSAAEQFVPAHSVAVAYRRSVFDAVGIFDEHFDACEDVELNHRIDRAGLRCLFTPRIAARYVPRSTLPGLFRQMMRYGRGRVRLLDKHPDTFSLPGFLPGAFVAGVVLGGALALACPALMPVWLAMLALYAATVLATSAWLALRARDAQVFFWLPAAFLAIHVGAGAGIVSEMLETWRGRLQARWHNRTGKLRWLPASRNKPAAARVTLHRIQLDKSARPWGADDPAPAPGRTVLDRCHHRRTAVPGLTIDRAVDNHREEETDPMAMGPGGIQEPVLNALTVDVEDYYHVTAFESFIARDQWDALESRIAASTGKVLDVLARASVRGTFFVLGWVADRHPEVVREIASAGHEIGCHSYWHRLVYDQTPDEFRADLQRARNVLEDVSGRKVIAYRAPSFSITRRSEWALDVLIEEGFTVDSSIYPTFHDRYGIPGAPVHPHRIVREGGTLWELPMPVYRLWGYPLPVGGGGYFRLYPYALTRHCLRALNAAGLPFVTYVHPWELDVDQPRLGGAGWARRFRHYVGLRHTAARLARLLQDFPLGTVSEVIRSLGGDPTGQSGKKRRAA